MTRLLLFGAGTPSGAALLAVAGTRPVLAIGRREPRLPDGLTAGSGFLPADLSRPGDFRPPQGKQRWISFAPIWLLASFLETLRRQYPERVRELEGVVACSSSSALTKRYAANRFDQDLVRKLRQSEEILLASCEGLGVPCKIMAPTLIYGEAGGYGDRNLSRLLRLMRHLPLLPVPAQSGLRQPIHARQLAAVALALSDRLEKDDTGAEMPEILPIGGDESLSYTAMLERLRLATPPGDRARRCRLLPLPPRVLLWLAHPLLLLSPKTFEAMQRTQADLADFLPAHRLLAQSPQSFPVPPLALGQAATRE